MKKILVFLMILFAFEFAKQQNTCYNIIAFVI
jgi:hypothetical protein